MKIRSYRRNDEVKPLIRKSIDAIDSDNYSQDQMKALKGEIPRMNLEFATKDRYVYYVAVEEGRILGLAGCQIESGTLSGVFVNPDYRSKGVGSCLLERIESRAVSEGLERLEAPASLDAVGFYEKNGYEDSGGRTEKIGGKCIEMRLMTKKLDL